MYIRVCIYLDTYIRRYSQKKRKYIHPWQIQKHTFGLEISNYTIQYFVHEIVIIDKFRIVKDEKSSGKFLERMLKVFKIFCTFPPNPQK